LTEDIFAGLLSVVAGLSVRGFIEELINTIFHSYDYEAEKMTMGGNKPNGHRPPSPFDSVLVLKKGSGSISGSGTGAEGSGSGSGTGAEGSGSGSGAGAEGSGSGSGAGAEGSGSAGPSSSKPPVKKES
jgi:hypothetical protein